MSEEIKCPACKGTKNITVTVHWIGKPSESSEITCVDCDGKGTLTHEGYEEYLFEKDMWCTCGKNDVAIYYEDGEHPEIYKHHWRCSNCKKVLQIG